MLQRHERGDPRRYRGRERLAQEWSERDVLPGLDVASGPVVEQDDAKDMRGKVAERDGPRELGADAHDESQLCLDIESLRGTEDDLVATFTLTLRANDLGTRCHDCSGPTVVADR